MSSWALGPSTFRRLFPLRSLGLRAAAAAGGTLILVGFLISGSDAFAQADSTAPAPTPISGVTVTDVPNDNGKALQLTWSPPTPGAPRSPTAVIIERGTAPSGPFTRVDSVVSLSGSYDDNGVRADQPVFYRLTALGPGGLADPVLLGPIVPMAQWFNFGRVNVAVFAIVFFGLVLFFLWSARGGRKLFVRRIPGIDAIEEAVGRATEMGRPVLYVPGVQDIDDIQTMAALVILESVAKTTAQYETKMIVPTNYPVVFTLAQEMV
jgi:hypothetical protein